MSTSSIRKFFNILAFVLVLNSSALVFLPSPVLAQTRAPIISKETRCSQFKSQFSLGTSTSATNITEGMPFFCSATDLLIPLIIYMLAISGTVTVLFLILGGFWYLTAAGNEEQVEKGKKTLINAVIGLVVITLSFAIVKIVTSTLLTVSVICK